jgi:hypothetical protein
MYTGGALAAAKLFDGFLHMLWGAEALMFVVDCGNAGRIRETRNELHAPLERAD